MAERRMFSLKIIDSDAFIEMPPSTQLLYFHLSMRADDDGFVNSPKGIMRMLGSGEDDIKILISKKFIIPFESGVVVIKHWKIHNYIQKDRYNETTYKIEKSQLRLDENNSYTTNQDDRQLDSMYRDKKPLTDAQQKRLNAKKESDLPYNFENKIRNAFVGKQCPICNCTMSYENNLVKPTIQHNIPISKGGKHELTNISVICNSCNTSIQNREITEPYNTNEVIKIWECIGNVSGMDTQVRLGKVSIDKDNCCSSIKDLLTSDELNDLIEIYDNQYNSVSNLFAIIDKDFKLKKKSFNEIEQPFRYVIGVAENLNYITNEEKEKHLQELMEVLEV